MADNQSSRPLAVITGASDGIGYELAKQFAEHGYDLVVCAEDPGIVEAAQAFQGLGATVEHVQADLCKPEEVEKVFQRIQLLGRPVDAIVLNAGVGLNGDFARETGLDANLKLIDLNVRSSVHLAHRVLREMAKIGKGRVMFTSSIASTLPGSFTASYNASKAFLQSFAEGIREELKDTGITVTSLMPGATETNFFHRAKMEDTKVGAGPKDSAADVAKDGFEAMMAGKDHVVAGSLKNKLETMVARVLPDPIKAKIHRGKSEPGSANK